MGKLIVVACGAGINTSTIAEDMIKERLEAEGLADVDDNARCDRPQEACEEQGLVAQKDLLWCAAQAFDSDQIEVAKDAIHHKGDGEHHGMVGRKIRG